MKTWVIIIIVAVVVLVAVVAITVVERGGSRAPAGKLTECEPCTAGCACDQTADTQTTSGP